MAAEHAIPEARALLLNWEHGGPDWHRVRVPATECPGISREFLEEERGPQKGDFGMEYRCKFREGGFQRIQPGFGGKGAGFERGATAYSLRF